MRNLKSLMQRCLKRSNLKIGQNLLPKNGQFLRSASSHTTNGSNKKKLKDLVRTITHPTHSYASTVSEFPMYSEVVGDLINKNLELNSNEVAYAFPHQKVHLSFDEIRERVETAAKNLLDLGFKKGERIAFILPNTYELAVLFLAASKIGLISAVLNPAYQLVELEHMLKKTSAKGLVFYDSFRTLKHMEVIRNICPEVDNCIPGELNSKALPNLKHIFVLNSPFESEKRQYKGTWNIDKITEKKSGVSSVEMPYVDMVHLSFAIYNSNRLLISVLFSRVSTSLVYGVHASKSMRKRLLFIEILYLL